MNANNKFGDADIVYQFVKALRSNWYRPEYAWECVFGDEYERCDNTPVEDFCYHMVEKRLADMEDEDFFWGKYVKGSYDRERGVGVFSSINDEKSEEYPISHKEWMDICVGIEDDPYAYQIEVYNYCTNGTGFLFHYLDEMPFDIWDESKWDFIHPTGREYFETTGNWVNEYEDDVEEEKLVKVIRFRV